MKRRDKTIIVIVALSFAILLLAFYYGCREGSQAAHADAAARPAERTIRV